MKCHQKTKTKTNTSNLKQYKTGNVQRDRQNEWADFSIRNSIIGKSKSVMQNFLSKQKTNSN